MSNYTCKMMGAICTLLLGVFCFPAYSGLIDTDPRYQKRAARPLMNWNMPVAANEIKIMTYNVENLFDATHDVGKQDYEYLPITSALKRECASQGPYRKKCEETDWTVEKMNMKLGQIQKALQAQGPYPDILALQEVENEKVIELLVQKLGYTDFVMTKSPDARGIDVALLYNESKLKLVSFREKNLGVPGLLTRNLLVANFTVVVRPAVGTLGVFVNHWPSQGKSSEARVQAAQALRTFVNEEAGRKTNYHAVLLGDFNTIDGDRPHPFREVILNPTWSEKFEDAQTLFESLKALQGIHMPPASYFYAKDGVWNRLDHIFVNKNLVDGAGMEIMPETFRIVAPEFMTRAFEYYYNQHHLYSSVIFGVPRRYNHDTKNPAVAGYSDHFPVSVKLKMN
ncbi:MAG: endonuclease/exonuclease/phosphatase family protein [Bdellovibrionales bacterium]